MRFELSVRGVWGSGRVWAAGGLLVATTLLSGVLLTASHVRAAESDSDGKDGCAYENLERAECSRVAAIVGHWHSPELQAIAIAGVPEPQPASDVHPDPELDAANARFMSRQSEIGPCRFNEAEARIEVTPSAFALSDSALTQCFSTAYAHARYYTIEAKWLTTVGSHEAWINRKGVMVKVDVDRKLEPVAARGLWASFAGRELVREAQVEVGEDTAGDRSIASAGSVAGGGQDAQVRELLGLK